MFSTWRLRGGWLIVSLATGSTPSEAEVEVGIDGSVFAGSSLDFEAPNVRVGFISGAVSIEPSVSLLGYLDSELFADIGLGLYYSPLRTSSLDVYVGGGPDLIFNGYGWGNLGLCCEGGVKMPARRGWAFRPAIGYKRFLSGDGVGAAYASMGFSVFVGRGQP
jgi:hypothetical protein